jgi:hypothetical protein
MCQCSCSAWDHDAIVIVRIIIGITDRREQTSLIRSGEAGARRGSILDVHARIR